MDTEFFDSEFCNVKFVETGNFVLIAWKKFCCFEDYRKPTLFALELLRAHRGSHLVIDARNGFEDKKEDIDWAFAVLLPAMADTDCKTVVFLMRERNEIEDEMDLWGAEFGKYFQVHRAASYDEAIQKLTV